MVVKTGYGYIQDSNGHIVSRCELPKGEHPLKDGYSYIEVQSRSELENVTLWIPPPTVEELERQKQEQLDTLDRQSIRALRAQMAKSCDPKDEDCQTLQAKENQAKALRGAQ
jgi:hypothetical protein